MIRSLSCGVKRHAKCSHELMGGGGGGTRSLLPSATNKETPPKHKRTSTYAPAHIPSPPSTYTPLHVHTEQEQKVYTHTHTHTRTHARTHACMHACTPWCMHRGQEKKAGLDFIINKDSFKTSFTNTQFPNPARFAVMKSLSHSAQKHAKCHHTAEETGHMMLAQTEMEGRLEERPLLARGLFVLPLLSALILSFIKKKSM